MKYIHSSIIIFFFSSNFINLQSNPFDPRLNESSAYPKFIQRNIFSDTGYFTIEWSITKDRNSLFLINENRIQLIYSGRDHLSTLSGLASGKYQLIVCPWIDTPENSSITSMEQSSKNLNSLDYQAFLFNDKSLNCDKIPVMVSHHSQVKTSLFFVTGIILFLSILGFILRILVKGEDL